MVIVISKENIKSPYDLPNSPPNLSKEMINKINNIQKLKEIEKCYDVFLEKRWHILLLLNQAEQILETRDLILIRISILERERKKKYQIMPKLMLLS